jgi:Domain of unknown function (DUF1906)
MRLVTATPNALYCDTDEVLTAAACALLKSKGILGVWRYLSGLTPAERDVILASGLLLFFINFSRDAGWIPSAAEGLADAQRDLTCLSALGIPKGVHVSFDLEGPGGTVADVIAHVTAHGTTIQASGNLASLYVGEGSLLTSAQLYSLPQTLYHASCSDLRDAGSGVDAGLVPACDYAIRQGRPFDVVLGSSSIVKVTIDYDYVNQDLKGRLPIGVAL